MADNLFTLAEATEFYNQAKDTYEKVLRAQKYDIKDRSLTRISLKDAREEMMRWKREVDNLTNGTRSGINGKRFVPRD